VDQAELSVIVAGAGPAGAVAARTLAAAGIRVLLIDKATFPRNKPCGGGISVRALGRFPWLRAALDGIDVHAVSRLQLESPDGAVLEMASPDPSMLLIRRVEFDHALVRDAERAGAEVRAPFDITQAAADAGGVTLRSRGGETLRASMLIAADGVHSVIAKRLGVNAAWPPQSIAVDMMEETPVETLRCEDPDVLWVSYGYKGLDGYAYVFPKVQHVNAGIGCLKSHFKDNVEVHPYEMQAAFVDGLVAKDALHGRSDRRHFTPFLIPVGGPLARPHDGSGRVLFAGDAGGFVNAFTAEGIYFAMVSGELAARAVVEGRESPARKYDELWKREIGPELRDAVLIQRFLFADPTRVNRLVHAARALPWIGELIVDYASGRVSYRDARRRILAASPKTAAKLAWMVMQKRLARTTC
jgi:geranylgeranyl reductase family protein